jgi:hypothetical protein
MAAKNNLVEGLPKEFCRWNETKKRFEVHVSICDPHKDNPRDKEEYEPDSAAQKRLMDSIEVEDWGGIHELCKGYVEDERLKLLVGHRRHAANVNLCKKHKDDPDKVEEFSWLPMDIVAEPESRLEVLLRMQTSNNLHTKWNTVQLVNFSKKLFAAAKAEGYDMDDPKVQEELGRAIGWAEGRLPVTVSVCKSPVLFAAVKDEKYTKCTYKTWRSVVELGKILMDRRFEDVIQDIAKARKKSPKKSKKLLEFVYELLVEKVSYYAISPKCQVGAVLERAKKPLRNSKFPAVRIQRWLTSNIDLTPNHRISLERETDGPRRNEIEAKFVMISDELTKSQQVKMQDSDIQDKMDTVTYNFADGTCQSDGVKVKAHTRTRRNRSPQTGTGTVGPISHSISIPGTSKRAYGLLCQQLQPILGDPKLLALCSESQKSLLDAAFKILRQGK